jgi:hypothetical protein
MSKEPQTIETDEPFLDQKTDRIVVVRPSIKSDEFRVEVPSHRDDRGHVAATSRPADKLRDAIESGQLESIDPSNLRDYCDSKELVYFAERDEFETIDADRKTAETVRYETWVETLSEFHGVTAAVEREKTFAPNLKVVADWAGGQSSNVFQLLSDEFDAPDDFLAVQPTERSDGSAATMFRISVGGRS